LVVGRFNGFVGLVETLSLQFSLSLRVDDLHEIARSLCDNLLDEIACMAAHPTMKEFRHGRGKECQVSRHLKGGVVAHPVDNRFGNSLDHRSRIVFGGRAVGRLVASFRQRFPTVPGVVTDEIGYVAVNHLMGPFGQEGKKPLLAFWGVEGWVGAHQFDKWDHNLKDPCHTIVEIRATNGLMRLGNTECRCGCFEL
jgi:hypothetical protein